MSRFTEEQARTNSWFHARKIQPSVNDFLKLSFEYLTRLFDCFARWHTADDLATPQGNRDGYALRIKHHADWIIEKGSEFSVLADEHEGSDAFVLALRARIDSRLEHWRSEIIRARRKQARSQQVTDLGVTIHKPESATADQLASLLAGSSRIRAEYLAANAADPARVDHHGRAALEKTFDLHALANLDEVNSEEGLTEYREWLTEVESTLLSSWTANAPLPTDTPQLMRARVAYWESEARGRIQAFEGGGKKAIPLSREAFLFAKWEELRPGRRWTDYAAAKVFELDPHVLRCYRTGETKTPREDTIKAIAKAAGVKDDAVPV